jgi:hypothetical protein
MPTKTRNLLTTGVKTSNGRCYEENIYIFLILILIKLYFYDYQGKFRLLKTIANLIRN